MIESNDRFLGKMVDIKYGKGGLTYIVLTAATFSDDNGFGTYVPDPEVRSVESTLTAVPFDWRVAQLDKVATAFDW